jgi:toxin CcdB
MARFDVRANLHRASRARVPYLLEIQADMLSALDTCLVAPLVPAAEFGPTATRRSDSVGNRVRDGYRPHAGVPRKLLGDRVAALATDRLTSLAPVVSRLGNLMPRAFRGPTE